MSTKPCPCGTGRSFDDCCGPLLATERHAETAEELMRSRYTAYIAGNLEHLWRTWDGRTRPEQILPSDVRWTRLEVREVVGGGPDDDTGIVDFLARHTEGFHAERAEFVRRGGRWFYTRTDS